MPTTHGTRMELDIEESGRFFVPDFKGNFLPWLPDVEVLRADTDRILKRVTSRLSDYHVMPARLVTIPKPRLRVRLGALPTLEDWLVYNGVVARIARSIENQLMPKEQQVLFSFRWDNNDPIAMFRSKHLPYQDFTERCLEYLNHVPFAQVTDMVDYFEHIDLRILRETLLRLGAEPDVVQFLVERLLGRWTHPSGRGIPQGPWASSYLGNVYLDALDKLMIQRGFNYVRYADDVRVFCSSINEARRAVMNLAEGCRELGLSLQSEKTDTLSAKRAVQLWVGLEQHLDHMQEKVAEQLKTYFVHLGPYGDESLEEVDADEDEVVGRTLRDLFDEVTNSVPAFKVHRPSVRFVLNRLRARKDSHCMDYCLRTLAELPDQAHVVSRYLEAFIGDRHVQASIIKFLNSDDNIYPWQCAHLLRLFSLSDSVSRAVSSYARRNAQDLNVHFALRAAAVQVVGRHGTEEDVRELRRQFASEPVDDVRVAIIIGCRRLHPEERQRFFDSCRGLSMQIDGAIKIPTET